MIRSTAIRIRPNTQAQAIARGIGWLSIARGLAELLAPATIKRHTGAAGPDALVQANGLRGIATGVAILAAERPVSMVWGRAAGNALDVAMLLPALRENNPQRAGAALAFVLAATALDVAVALQGDEREVEVPI